MKNKRNHQLIVIASIISVFAIAVLRFEVVLGAASSILAVLSPLYIGLFFAFMLNRPQELLFRLFTKVPHCPKKVARLFSVLTALALLIGSIVGIFFVVVPQVATSINKFASQYSGDEINRIGANLTKWFQENHINPIVLTQVSDAANTFLQKTISGLLPLTMEFITALPPKLMQVTIGIIIAIYILLDKEKLISQFGRIIKAFLPEKRGVQIVRVVTLACHIFADFVIGQMLEALILGSLLFVGMIIFSFEYAFMISVVIAVTSLVPIIGPYVGGAIGVLILALSDPRQGFWFLVLLLVIQQIEGNLIYPHTVGKRVGLPAMWVMLAVCIGVGLGGVLGALISVPFAALVYYLGREEVLLREAKLPEVELETKDIKEAKEATPIPEELAK